MTTGVMLINLGTPKSPKVSDVKRYLKTFLSDPKVIDLPTPIRWLLLHGLILPFRPKKSAHAYQQIWTDSGSPLLINSEKLCQQVQAHLGKAFRVELAMRYGQPSIEHASTRLKECERILVLPLFPQYAESSSGSAIEKSMHTLNKTGIKTPVQIISEFYQEPDFIEALSQHIAAYITQGDFLLFSYHGIPVRQNLKRGCEAICPTACEPLDLSTRCYRKQCFQTTHLIAQRLNLARDNYQTSFQSRLGKAAWLAPYTDHVLTDLAEKNVKRLTVVCPSFVADCLETLEEIGIQARQQWLALGGESFQLIPCLNDSTSWVQGLSRIIQTRCALKN